MENLTAQYWQQRYQDGYTGWDVGHTSGAMKHIIDQLPEEEKDIKILVPGGGNGYEVAYLWENGFRNVYLLDWARAPLDQFKKKHPGFPEAQLLHVDFFKLEAQFDLVLEQTFFCALLPEQRKNYVEKMNQLLVKGGILRGVLFQVPLFVDRPPFGGSVDEYRELFGQVFEVIYFQDCAYSEPARMGTEVEFKVSKK